MALEMALEQRAIGRRIAELREQAHLTQPVAAEKAGVSLRGYQKWEAGAARPNWTNLEKLASVFGVKPEDIIGERSSMNGNPPDIEARLKRVETALANQLQVLLAMAERLGIEGAEALPGLERSLGEIVQMLGQDEAERGRAQREARNRAAGDGSSREQR